MNPVVRGSVKTGKEVISQLSLEHYGIASGVSTAAPVSGPPTNTTRGQ